MDDDPEALQDAMKLKAEAEFAIFDSLPAGHREHLRNGGKVQGYDEACEPEWLRRYLTKGATS